MPQLRQYSAQVYPHGVVAPVLPDAPRVGGLVAGVTNAADTIQREADYRQAMMAREADQIAKEEAQAAVSKTISEKRAEYTEKIITRQQSGEPLAGMTAALLKDFDADSEKTIAAAPELGRRAMTVRMAELKSHLHEKAFGMEADARRAQVVTDFSTGLDSDARVLFADHTQFTSILGARLAAANALTLDPQTKAKILDDTRETLAYSAASGLVDKSPDAFLARTGNSGGKIGKDGKPLPSDAARAAEAVKNDPMLSNMRPAHLQQLTERATMMIVQREAMLAAQREQAQRRAEAAAEKLAREQDRAWLIVSDRLRNGIPTDPSAPELRILSGSPYAAEYAQRVTDVAKRASVAALPLPQQAAQLDALKAQRLTGTNKALDHEIEQREQILRGAQSDYKDEPLRAAAQRGVFGAQGPGPLDVSTLDSAINGMTFRVEQAKLAETRTGQAVSPFLSDEATQVARQLQALPWNERGRRIVQLASKMTPGQAQAFAKQVDPQNRSLALELAAGTSLTKDGKAVAQWIGRGREFMSDKPQDQEKFDVVRNNIANVVGDSLAGQTRRDVIDAAFYAYMGQQGAGMGATPEGVVRLVLGGPVTEHNGVKIPVPQGIDIAQALRAGLYTMKLGPLFAAGKPIDAAAFRALLPDAQLDPAGFGQYRVRAGDGFVTDANRVPVVVKVVQ